MLNSKFNSKIKVGLTKRTVDQYTDQCLLPQTTGERIWKITVLAVCTDKGPLLDNWKKSLEINGYDYEVLGLGKKWGGWSWRTKQYIERLANEKEERLFVLTDANDLFFIAPPNELIFNFKTYRSDVVNGAEHSPMTGPLKYDFQLKEQVVDFVKTRNHWTRYLVPNGGFIMGFRTPLLNILCANLHEEDDQHGYLINWLGHPDDMKLDIYARLVSNIVYDVPFLLENDDERIEMDYFELIKTNRGIRVRSIETNGMPCVMHFPGANYEAYNYFAKFIFDGELNEWAKPKKSLTDTIKKSWTQTLKANLIPKFLSGVSKSHKTYEFGRLKVKTENCVAHFKDCKGICGGNAVFDCNNVCYDPDIEQPTAIIDCNRVCGGNASLDCNGICNGPNELDCNGNCYNPITEIPLVIVDCNGVCGGNAIIDDCGKCCVRDDSYDSYSSDESW